jgi:hypothetical protein
MENKTPATDILRNAAELIEERGRERDLPNGERSMARCVNMFNAKYDMGMTEEQGWCFMEFLKHAREVGGEFNWDDYMDKVAYAALAAECASKRVLQNDKT